MVGMASAVFSLARQSYLTEAVPFHYRARALSTLGGVMRIGLFLGPFLAAAADPRAAASAAPTGVGVGALVARGGWSRSRMPDLPASARRARRRPRLAAARAPRRRCARSRAGHAAIFLTVGIGVLLVSAVRASRQAVIPLWAEHIGLDAATTSLIYGLAGGIDMLVFYPAGKVMDRKGRAWVAVPSMLIMGVALLLTPFTHSAPTLLLAALLIGFGNGIGSGMIMTLGADYSPARRPRPLPRRLAPDVGHRLDRRAGAALGRDRRCSRSPPASAAPALLAFAAAAVLWYWIPRTARHPAR